MVGIMDELGLFPGPERSERWERLRGGVARLAAEGIFVGTSSWKYPGWVGWLYERERYVTRGRFSEARFERECLREYAEVFSSVSVDAGYYAFPSPGGMERLCGLVPEGFRLSFKVTDEITLRRFPRIERFGERAGRENPHFLDAGLFCRAFLGPLEPYRAKTGVLMFEFARFAAGTWGEPGAFAGALDGFFSQLPRDWQYGVELRNPELLHPEYLEVLRRHGVAHVLNNWQGMPSVGEQLDVPGVLTAPFAAARFLLKPGRAYEEAVRLFSPYDRLREPVVEARQAARRLIQALEARRLAHRVPAGEDGLVSSAEAAGERPGPVAPAPRRSPPPSYIFVNNRLEGHALETILAMVEG
jgi:uncharacterized protein YecE (DUF72 family)